MNHSTQKTWKKALSVLLVFALLVPMIPAPVFAADSALIDEAQLEEMVEQLMEYRDIASNIENELKKNPCLKENGDCEYSGTAQCPEWTHRLRGTVAKDEFILAVSSFISNIDTDLAIVNELTSGAITTEYRFADTNGANYYTKTQAKTQADRTNAAGLFLKDGGYNCGDTTFNWGWKVKNQLAYRSKFNPSYKVDISALGKMEPSNTNGVLPLAEGIVNILLSGATADHADILYNLKRTEIERLIGAAKKLKDSGVPEGGTYTTQEEYNTAIDEFVRKAERDLYISSFLVNRKLEKSYNSRWIVITGDPVANYANLTSSESYANAFRYLNEGGYTWNIASWSPLLAWTVEFKSDFFKEYSSELGKKASIASLMEESLEALKQGVSTKEYLKTRYEQSLERLEALQDHPEKLMKALLENSPDLEQLIDDFDTVLGSLDAILNTLDKLESMGIGKDILDPILQQVGLSYDALDQLSKLKETLDPYINVNDGSIEDYLETLVDPLLDAALTTLILTAKAEVLAGTEGAYRSAASRLDGAYDDLMRGSASIINMFLDKVVGPIREIRPYLDMINSGISLTNHVITLADQVNGLTQDFTAGKLSAATYTMAYSLDDMADLLEALDRSGLGNDLLKLLENSDVGGAVADQTAGFLNQLINQLIQQDVGISGSDLGFLKDTANSLLQNGLKNPAALVDLLRTSSNILKRIAVLEGGAQDIIDGNYESAWNALTNDFGSIFRHTATLWNELVALFETPAAQGASTLALDPQTGEISLAAVQEDTFLTSFVQGINQEAVETLAVIKDPSTSNAKKMAKINEFRNFLKDIGKFVTALEDMSKSVKSACTWADNNLTKQEARAFTEQLARHYVERMRGCVESGWDSGSLKKIISEMKNAADEIRDILCFIKSTGDLKIIATEGEGDVFYTFSTNYDELRTKLDPVLKELGIRTGYTVYTVNSDVNLFQVGGDDENALLAAGDLETKTYQVKVAYKLFFDVCSHGVVCTLATTYVDVQIEEGPVDPEPVLTGIAVTSPPTTNTYTEGDTLDLTGLVVTGYYDDESEQVIPLADCTFSPVPGAVLDTVGTITVTVSFGGFETTFTVTVNGNGGEQKKDVTVTFDPNGGKLAAEAANTVTVKEGTAVLLPNVEAWPNHVFNGWSDGTTKVGTAGESYTVNWDIKLIAQWTDNTPSNPGGGGSGGGGSSLVQIQDEAIPLGGIFSLMSLNAEPKNGIVYYTDGGKTIFVPFCFVIGDKIYFFGQVGIEYHVKANPKQFKDVNGHWAYDNIMAITEREAFQGYPDNSFQPNSSMTRAMLAAVLARMAMVDTSAYTTRIFDDVAPDAWYGPSVAWAFEQGIVTGMGNNKFNPNANVTRQEISVMLSRFVNYMQIRMKTVDSAPFADQDQASAWAKAAITDMQKYDIVGGKSNNRFDPYADSTRAEIATMLYRLIQASITYEQENNASSVKKTN